MDNLNHKFKFMCPNVEEAKRNRERVAEFLNQDYYAQQAYAIAQWQWGNQHLKIWLWGNCPS